MCVKENFAEYLWPWPISFFFLPQWKNDWNESTRFLLLYKIIINHSSCVHVCVCVSVASGSVVSQEKTKKNHWAVMWYRGTPRSIKACIQGFLTQWNETWWSQSNNWYRHQGLTVTGREYVDDVCLSTFIQITQNMKMHWQSRTFWRWNYSL